MSPSFETLLFLGVIAFYLYDSAMLLCINELVFFELDDRWSFACPGSSWQLLRRNPYLPNPLKPNAAVFRVFWSEFERPGQTKAGDTLKIFIGSLMPLRNMAVFLFVLQVMVLPAVLFLFGSGPELLILFAVVYLNISLMLIYAFRRRKVLGVSEKQFLILASESLLCAPFALNMLRKITLRRSLGEGPADFASHAFESAMFCKLIDAICGKVDEQLEIVDLESARFLALQSYRDRVRSMNR